MQANETLAMVFARNAFYKRLHFFVLYALILAIVVIGILTGILIHMLRYPTPPLYFATDAVSRLIPVIPVDKPNMSLDDVKNWTIEAIQKAMSFDFINFRAQLQSAQKYFLDYGWRNYMDSLTLSRNLLGVQQNKFVTLAQVIGQPKLNTQGTLAGAYAWRLDMPVIVTVMYPPFDEKSFFTNYWQVSAVVQRAPILQSYRGLGILQIITTRKETQQQQQTLSPGSPGVAQ